MNNRPQISIVTPSFNQGHFLERTLVSVLGQEYAHAEHIVIDGGSSDASLETIKKYEHKITYWCSEPDNGQYHAINKGFGKSRGEIMAFLNADDVYLPWTLKTVASIFDAHPEVEWITSLRPQHLNEHGEMVAAGAVTPVSKKGFGDGLYVPGAKHSLGCIVQEGTFWRRSLWDKCGSAMNERYGLAADFDLWCRFFQHADLYCIGLPLAAMTRHAGQRSNQVDLYTSECMEALEEYGKRTGKRPKSQGYSARVSSMRQNRFLWALYRRMLNYHAWVIDPVFDRQNHNTSWKVKDILIY